LQKIPGTSPGRPSSHGSSSVDTISLQSSIAKRRASRVVLPQQCFRPWSGYAGLSPPPPAIHGRAHRAPLPAIAATPSTLSPRREPASRGPLARGPGLGQRAVSAAVGRLVSVGTAPVPLWLSCGRAGCPQAAPAASRAANPLVDRGWLAGVAHARWVATVRQSAQRSADRSTRCAGCPRLPLSCQA